MRATERVLAPRGVNYYSISGSARNAAGKAFMSHGGLLLASSARVPERCPRLAGKRKCILKMSQMHAMISGPLHGIVIYLGIGHLAASASAKGAALWRGLR